MARILTAAWHPVVLAGIRETIARELPDGLVVGEVTTARQFIASLDRLKPDIAIVDVAITWKCGVDLLDEVRRIHPEIELRFIAVHPLDRHVVDYLEEKSRSLKECLSS